MVGARGRRGQTVSPVVLVRRRDLENATIRNHHLRVMTARATVPSLRNVSSTNAKVFITLVLMFWIGFWDRSLCGFTALHVQPIGNFSSRIDME